MKEKFKQRGDFMYSRKQEKITVVTCTYNRAHTLKDVYYSLMNQTSHKFQWVIFDDGSTDKTQDIVIGWVNECKLFPIIYKRIEKNQGYSRAWNAAIRMVKSDYVIFCDSNKKLTREAIELGYQYLDSIKEIEEDFAGVAGMRSLDDGTINGGVPLWNGQTYIDASNLERWKYNLGGEKAEIYKTKLLMKHLLPEIEGEKFATEAIAFDAIAAEGYKIRWFPDILCVGNFESGGLTRSGANGLSGHIENYWGYLIYVRQSVRFYQGKMKYYLLVEFFETENHLHHNLRESARMLEVSIWNIMGFLLWLRCFKIFNIIKILKSKIWKKKMQGM